jgi:hypothetical protein
MVYQKKNKPKKIYICPNCLKDFGNDKYNLELHLNRINPCKKNNDLKNKNDKEKEKNDDLKNEKEKEINNDLNGDKNYIFNNENIHYNDILSDFLTEEENDEIFEKPNYNDILKNNNEINGDMDNSLIFEFMKKMDLIIKQNEKMNNDILNLNGEITKLKEDNENLKNQIITNNEIQKNSTNYTLNINFQINNFNDTKDFKGNFNNLLNESGKNIYLKTIENLYLNPEKPENHNIYITDKNRGYVKVYNNGRWETKNINILDEIINNVVEYFNLSLEKLKEDNDKYERLKNRLLPKIKYIELCDLEFLEDLEDKQINEDIDNKDMIKRCVNFRNMVYEDIKILFHDKKDIVLNTIKKQKINIIQD